MILDYIDDFLNDLTMYRLLAYGLSIISAIAVAFSVLGVTATRPPRLVISLVILLGVCYAANKVFAKVWQAVPNQESWLITALILFLIMPPATNPAKALGLIAVGAIAMASKYILAIHHKHLFNPAALAAVIVGLLNITPAEWWIGSGTYWPYTLVFGLLVVRKIRRFRLFLSFVIASLIVTFGVAAVHHMPLMSLVRPTLLESPLIFLGTIMLTEPATMPPRKNQQLVFGALVGALSSWHLQLAGVFIYPETALVVGNIYAYAVSPTPRLRLRLKEVQKMSERVYNYVFEPDRPLKFKAGQYLEWTLPGVAFDGRGNRRTFTIASSPTEQSIMMGVKFYEPSSAFKKRLRELKPGDLMVAGELGGNFTLPHDTGEKLLFIAGGIGITPFRSMLKYTMDNKEKRDIVLIYLVSDPHEVSFRQELQQANEAGMRIIPVLTHDSSAPWQGLKGQLSAEMLDKHVDDFHDRKIYISGPDKMVKATRRLMRGQGVGNGRIITDYFAGY